MDEFKASMGKHLGVGGVKCRCCNSYFGKSKKKLNRMARSGLRQQDIKQQNKLLGEEYLLEDLPNIEASLSETTNKIKA